MRLISCRRCGRPCPGGRKGLCGSCATALHSSGHGSSEYQRNAAAVRSQAALTLRYGGSLFCGICRAPIVATDAIQVDHITKLRDGGSHALINLRPVHARCNASHH
jgi:5-methylcytosine-specific restriction endonuclease McrA